MLIQIGGLITAHKIAVLYANVPTDTGPATGVSRRALCLFLSPHPHLSILVVPAQAVPQPLDQGAVQLAVGARR
jgi:hypothetical protein